MSRIYETETPDIRGADLGMDGPGVPTDQSRGGGDYGCEKQSASDSGRAIT